jgi:hypothetical protein
VATKRRKVQLEEDEVRVRGAGRGCRRRAVVLFALIPSRLRFYAMCVWCI